MNHDFAGPRALGRLARTCLAALGLGLALPAVLPTAAIAQAAPAEDVRKVIHAGRLFDGVSGKLSGPCSILIAGTRVVAIEEGFVSPVGAEVIDLSNSTVMPGVIDGHTHMTSLPRTGNSVAKNLTYSPLDVALAATVNARKVLLSGVTTVRDLGGLYGADTALRKAIERGSVVGPRMWNAGEAIGPTAGHNDWSSGLAEDVSRPEFGAGLADGADAVLALVRKEHKLGAKVIKILPSGGVVSQNDDPKHKLMTDAEIAAAVEGAHMGGLKIAAHGHGKAAIDAAVRLGADSIEHGTYADAESFALMREHGTVFLPTLLTTYKLHETAVNRPEALNPSTRAKVLAMGTGYDKLTRAYKAGVRIGFGSDTGFGENLQEAALMVEAGMPPREVLMAATSGNADLIGSQDIGAIAKGRLADIIAVAGNPLEDMHVLEAVEFVMKNGVVYKSGGREVPVDLVNP